MGDPLAAIPQAHRGSIGILQLNEKHSHGLGHVFVTYPQQQLHTKCFARGEKPIATLQPFNLTLGLLSVHLNKQQMKRGVMCHGDNPGDFSLEDALYELSTKRRKDFDLADALDDKNDGKDARRPDIRPDEGLSDDDLASIVDGGYSPDKKKGAGGSTDNDYSGSKVADTGTIAGIASGLAMALIGAVTSYISYQQKKFCFSIQQGLNSEYVKGENMEAVVSEEPQVKYSVLETQSAEPPKQDSAKM
ncbi:PREDICTED: CD99 antigen-like protein 2 [Nestor notabilis]|uniref:CD99 antigen-like protein 2 n=1 Tax=Nestor notabilis TaxID=176057 RepID=UPI0005234EB2|nr:PREDICTED: CD99 antigen-like protein 2 [Nestor notabilis]